MSKRRGRFLRLAVLAAAVTAVAGWTIGQAAASEASRAGTATLKPLCGDKIVIQTDWFPEPEHGALYQLAGTNGSLDAGKGRYTGTIRGTGVQVEIRAGGPFTGFQQPISRLYQDTSITLGYVNTDEAVSLSGKFPTVAIVAPLEFSPQILMWNPEKLNIKRFADIKGTGAKVLVSEGGAYYHWLVAKGWIDQSQLDTSYDGSPARFVAADGAIVQQGFATSEPYLYRNDIKEWGKPVKFLLIRNSGWIPYAEPLAARPDVIREKRACFKRLVPLIQKAQVEYIKNPGPVNRKLVQIVTDLNTFWKETMGGNAFNTQQQVKLGIVQNGPNCTLGDFNLGRVDAFIARSTPIFQKLGYATLKSGLKATDIVTNEFIDSKIGLPKTGCP